MNNVLQFRELVPKNPKQIVLLLHGYGSNQDDLISLAPELATYLPNAAFISANAPQPFEGDPRSSGRQWFSLASREPDDMYAGAEKAMVSLRELIINQAARFQIDYSQIALVGFSQGSMMSMHTMFRLEFLIAGAVCYSGMMIKPELLQTNIKPPVMLVHGAEDQIVPLAQMYVAYDALDELGISVEAIERPMLAHGIDEVGIHTGGKFLQKILMA